MSSLVGIGSAAPDFTLLAQDGRLFSLKEHLGRSIIVLFFYPKDETPVCTREACAFRDSHGVFAEAGAEVIGISADAEESHRAFIGRHNLPYTLLSDPGNSVADIYGVPRFLFFKGRVTFVIDRGGKIRHVHSAIARAEEHVREALKAVRSLAGEEPERKESRE